MLPDADDLRLADGLIFAILISCGNLRLRFRGDDVSRLPAERFSTGSLLLLGIGRLPAREGCENV